MMLYSVTGDRRLVRGMLLLKKKGRGVIERGAEAVREIIHN